jgi:hypothetical protein
MILNQDGQVCTTRRQSIPQQVSSEHVEMKDATHIVVFLKYLITYWRMSLRDLLTTKFQ